MSPEIVGTCQGIIEKPTGWTEFEIAVPGKQYPVRLATKQQPLVELARATHGSVATWTYNEVESEKINEHTGKPYVNRYLEGVTAGAAEVPGAPEAHHQPVHFADKDRAITRMACLKAAAVIIAGAGVVQEDPALEAMKTAQRFETWVYRDIAPVPFEPSPLSEHDRDIPF